MGGRLCAVLAAVRQRVLELSENWAACSEGWRESQGWSGVWIGVRASGTLIWQGCAQWGVRSVAAEVAGSPPAVNSPP